MSYPEPPRRPRYPTLAQYEDDFQSHQQQPSQGAPRAYQDPPPARAPWEEETRFQAPVTPEPSYDSQANSYAPWEPRESTYAPWERPTRASETSQIPPVWDMAGIPETGQGVEDGDGRRSRGLLGGAAAGFLAAAVALGIANLVAAFVRPQASPIIAVGGAFIDRTPPALKNFAVEKFGENDKTMLLLGMYVTIAIIAIVIGMIAWRHVSVGVLGIGLFGLFGAFVAVTRPESHTTDVIPSLVGGIAGIAAIILLVRLGTAGRPGPVGHRGRSGPANARMAGSDL